MGHQHPRPPFRRLHHNSNGRPNVMFTSSDSVMTKFYCVIICSQRLHCAVNTMLILQTDQQCIYKRNICSPAVKTLRVNITNRSKSFTKHTITQHYFLTKTIPFIHCLGSRTHTVIVTAIPSAIVTRYASTLNTCHRLVQYG